MCECKFDPYEDDEDDKDKSFHYKRTCTGCGESWWSLHCPHDGAQGRCMSCGKRPDSIPED